MNASRPQKLMALGAVGLAIGTYWMVTDRRTFKEDVRTICSAEARTEIKLASGRVAVESYARKNVRGERGIALVENLKGSAPDSAANQLEHATESAGITDCPTVASYRSLTSRVALQKSVVKMCAMEPTAIAKLPRAARFARLQEWTRTNVSEPAVDDLLASIDQQGGTPDEKTARLRAAAAGLDIHECGILSGLGSHLDPVPGPNVLVSSVALQSDAREAALATDLRGKAPALRQCYEAALAKDPKLAGAMTVKLRVVESGAVDFALSQEDSTIVVPAMVSCVLDVVKSAHVPAGPTKSAGGMTAVFWVAK